MIKITANDFCLTELLTGLNHGTQIFFFESLDTPIGPIQYLGIGELKKISTTDHLEIERLTKENPNLFFIYRCLFESDSGELTLPLFSFFRAHNKVEMNVYADVNFSHYFSAQAFKINSVTTQRQIKHAGKISQNPPFDEWKKNITGLLNEMNQKDAPLQKVVLSRKTVFNNIQLSGPINLFLKNYQNQKSAGFSIFSYDAISKKAFISFTPERLLAYHQCQITTVSLAGSLPRSQDYAKDQKLEASLNSEKKLKCEQDFVTHDIIERLNSWCEEIEISPMTPLKLNYIQHRKSRISGKTKMDLNVGQLINGPISDLHPTPAVGGAPKALAAEKIKAIEKTLRGHYAAPIGITSLNFTDIAVGIRSCLYDEKSQELTLFGGVGIVPGSDPKKEWDEAEIKMSPFLKTLYE